MKDLLQHDISMPASITAPIEKRDPKSLFHYRRLDLIVKYLWARNILEKRNNTHIESLYNRHILMRTGGNERVHRFSNVQKNALKEYTESLPSLLMSIAENGFNPSFAVPVSSSGLLYNGAHRIACCQALGKDVYTWTAGDKGDSWDFAWFHNNGFTLDDKQRILKGFIDIHPERSAIMLVWRPVREHLDQIKTLVAKSLDIVGEVELSFENHYIAFTNLLLEIYAHSNTAYSRCSGSDTIVAKAELLRSWPLTISVLALTNQEKSKDSDIHHVVSIIKNDIRKSMAHIIPEEIFATLHTSSTQEECCHLSNILFSPNNLKHLRMRMLVGVKNRFLDLCEETKKILAGHSIEQADACVVASGCLGVFGLEDETTDIDLILTSREREKFGDNGVKLSEGVDLARRGYCSSVETLGNSVTDDIIIHDHDFHFMFNGLKFLNLELVKQRKNADHRKKDFMHIRKIELLENITGYYNHQKSIKFGIETEQKRRSSSLSFISLEKIQQSLGQIQQEIKRIKEEAKIKCIKEEAKFKGEIRHLKLQIEKQKAVIANFEKQKSERAKKDSALKRKHQAYSLSRKQRIIFRIITPIVKKFATEVQFIRFKETPALFFKSLQGRKYRIFGEIFFPSRRGLF